MQHNVCISSSHAISFQKLLEKWMCCQTQTAVPNSKNHSTICVANETPFFNIVSLGDHQICSNFCQSFAFRPLPRQCCSLERHLSQDEICFFRNSHFSSQHVISSCRQTSVSGLRMSSFSTERQRVSQLETKCCSTVLSAVPFSYQAC